MVRVLKIVFMGSPEFAVKPLKALVDSKHEIGLVISQPDKRRSRNKYLPTPVKKYAIEEGLEIITPIDVNDPQIVNIIDKVEPDILVVIAYGQMIKESLLSKYENRIVNIHASLLPKYRGSAPINWAILNGDEKTGVCSMLIERGMDTGDVLTCSSVDIEADDDAESLSEKLSIKAGELIIDTLDNFDHFFAHRKKQGPNYSLAPKLYKDMGEINWNNSAGEIYDQVRALKPWPGTFTKYGEDLLKIHKVKIVAASEVEFLMGKEDFVSYEAGSVFEISKDRIFVKCKDALLEILEIQFPNKNRTKISDYLKGNKFEIERLG